MDKYTTLLGLELQLLKDIQAIEGKKDYELIISKSQARLTSE